MLFELIAFGSIVSWLVLASIVILYIVLIDNDSGWGSSLLTAGVIIALTLFTSFNPFIYMYTHAQVVALGALAYLFVGISWGVIKWWFFLLNVSQKAKGHKEKFLSDVIARDRYASDEAYTNAMLSYVNEKLGYVGIPPAITKHKARFMTWLAYWPVSAVWTLLNDPIKHLYRFIYERLANGLQGISNYMFKGFSDFPPKN